MGNIIRYMKVNGLKRKCIAKFRGGSTIEWARRTAADLQPNVTTVFQTGVNNLLNTNQDNKNIIHQFRMLTKEGIERGNTVIVTSILPTDIGGYELNKRVNEINMALSRVVPTEGGIFMDMTQHFVKDGYLVRELYSRERHGLLLLSAAGANIMAHKINETVINQGGREIIEDFRSQSLWQRT